MPCRKQHLACKTPDLAHGTGAAQWRGRGAGARARCGGARRKVLRGCGGICPPKGRRHDERFIGALTCAQPRSAARPRGSPGTWSGRGGSSRRCAGCRGARPAAAASWTGPRAADRVGRRSQHRRRPGPTAPSRTGRPTRALPLGSRSTRTRPTWFSPTRRSVAMLWILNIAMTGRGRAEVSRLLRGWRPAAQPCGPGGT